MHRSRISRVRIRLFLSVNNCFCDALSYISGGGKRFRVLFGFPEFAVNSFSLALDSQVLAQVVDQVEHIASVLQAASAASQRCVEVPFDVDLQKARKQSCLNHLFERFGKPVIIILCQKNNPPIVERL